VFDCVETEKGMVRESCTDTDTLKPLSSEEEKEFCTLFVAENVIVALSIMLSL